MTLSDFNKQSRLNGLGYNYKRPIPGRKQQTCGILAVSLAIVKADCSRLFWQEGGGGVHHGLVSSEPTSAKVRPPSMP